MDALNSVWVWTGFIVFLMFALVVDAKFSGRYRAGSEHTIKSAVGWTIFWVISALIFNALLWFYLVETADSVIAHQKSLEFFTGYVIEKSLSVDNLFVFFMVFEQLRVPKMYQQRVFNYGIWGAIIMRLGVILIGVWLVVHFHWLLYVMGFFLVLTGIKMMVTSETKKDVTETFIIRLTKKFIRITPTFHEEHFFIRESGRLVATPLFLALIFIEFSDLVFAFDSIPAIFAITQDPFIVWSSNIFAILGLRSLYFVMVRMIHRFELLKYGIALILVFVGAKMMLEPIYAIPTVMSLLVVGAIIFAFTMVSVLKTSKEGVE